MSTSCRCGLSTRPLDSGLFLMPRCCIIIPLDLCHFFLFFVVTGLGVGVFGRDGGDCGVPYRSGDCLDARKPNPLLCVHRFNALSPVPWPGGHARVHWFRLKARKAAKWITPAACVHSFSTKGSKRSLRCLGVWSPFFFSRSQLLMALKYPYQQLLDKNRAVWNRKQKKSLLSSITYYYLLLLFTVYTLYSLYSIL